MTQQPWFAVRVTVYTTGDTFTRDYVRGQKHMGRDAFEAWAMGDLLRLVGVPNETEQVRAFGITELTPEQVYANRRYHHTTH